LTDSQQYVMLSLSITL